MEDAGLERFMEGLFALAEGNEPVKIFNAFVFKGEDQLSEMGDKDSAVWSMARSFYSRMTNHFPYSVMADVLLSYEKNHGSDQISERMHLEFLSNRPLARITLEYTIERFTPTYGLSLEDMIARVRLFDLAMKVFKEDERRNHRIAPKARILALHCGLCARKETSTPEKEKEFLPLAPKEFAEWYSCGLQLRDGIAYGLVDLNRKLTMIAAGSEEDDASMKDAPVAAQMLGLRILILSGASQDRINSLAKLVKANWPKDWGQTFGQWYQSTTDLKPRPSDEAAFARRIAEASICAMMDCQANPASSITPLVVRLFEHTPDHERRALEERLIEKARETNRANLQVDFAGLSVIGSGGKTAE